MLTAASGYSPHQPTLPVIHDISKGAQPRSSSTLTHTQHPIPCRLTKFNEMVRSLGLVNFLAILLAELSVEVFQVTECQSWGVTRLTQSQVADTCFYDVAGGGGGVRDKEVGRKGTRK